MHYASEIQHLSRFLAARGFKAEVVPGSVPGESASLIASNGNVIEPDAAPEGLAAAAHLWSLLHDLRDNVITKEAFDSFGGKRCRDLVRREWSLAPKAPKPQKVLERLAEKLHGARFKLSQRGTPLVVVGTRSICWFGTNRVYRVFDDHGVFTAKQKKRDFKSEEEVVSFFESQGVAVTR